MGFVMIVLKNELITEAWRISEKDLIEALAYMNIIMISPTITA
jgi:hypothetical protein